MQTGLFTPLFPSAQTAPIRPTSLPASATGASRYKQPNEHSATYSPRRHPGSPCQSPTCSSFEAESLSQQSSSPLPIEVAVSVPQYSGRVRLQRSRSLPPTQKLRPQVGRLTPTRIELAQAAAAALSEGRDRQTCRNLGTPPKLIEGHESPQRHGSPASSRRANSPSVVRRPATTSTRRKSTDSTTVSKLLPLSVQGEQELSPQWESQLRDVEQALRAKLLNNQGTCGDLFTRVHRCIAGLADGSRTDGHNSDDEEVARLEKENEKLMETLAQQKAQLRSLVPVALLTSQDTFHRDSLNSSHSSVSLSGIGTPPLSDVTSELRCQLIESESRNFHPAEVQSNSSSTSPSEEEPLQKIQFARGIQDFHCVRQLMAGEAFILEVQCKRVPDTPLLLKVIPGYKADGSSWAHQANLHEFRLLRTIPPSEFLLPMYHYFVDTPEKIIAGWPLGEPPPALPAADALCLVMPLAPISVGRLAHCWRDQSGQAGYPERVMLYFVYQTLRGLQHLHGCKLLHGALGEHSVVVSLATDRPSPIGALLNAMTHDPFALRFRLRDFRKSVELGRNGREKDDIAALGALTHTLSDTKQSAGLRHIIQGLSHPDPAHRWSISVALAVVGTSLFGPGPGLGPPLGCDEGLRISEPTLQAVQQWLARARHEGLSSAPQQNANYARLQTTFLVNISPQMLLQALLLLKDHEAEPDMAQLAQVREQLQVEKVHRQQLEEQLASLQRSNSKSRTPLLPGP